MKKTVLNFAILGLSLLSLCIFAQLKSFNVISLHLAKESACSITDIAPLKSAENTSKEVVGQKVIEETMPMFHQQLSTFSPF